MLLKLNSLLFFDELLNGLICLKIALNLLEVSNSYITEIEEICICKSQYYKSQFFFILKEIMVSTHSISWKKTTRALPDKVLCLFINT